LDIASVLRLCGEQGMLENSKEYCTMGVDTGKDLHVVISTGLKDKKPGRRIVWLGAVQEFAQLDELMARFNVSVCVIDALPETHVTRRFAMRHHGHVYMNYFNEHQKGSWKWDWQSLTVQENRTEALDYSRRLIRDGLRVLPRQSEIVSEFARHLTCDAKQLHEDADTGAQEYRYIRTGENHFSMAFTYDCLAAARASYQEQPVVEWLEMYEGRGPFWHFRLPRG
jgi:hypothetical protein